MLRLLIAMALAVLLPGSLKSAVIYQNSFDDGSAGLFGNQRGNWVAADGVYSALSPGNLPPTFSALPFDLRDFTIEMDIRAVSDGGVWLRSRDNNGRMSGVLLVTGGWNHTGRGFYWHTVFDDSYAPVQNESVPLFNQGQDIHIRVQVSGDTYSVYLNDGPAPVTTLVTSQFESGQVGLYDYSGQSFDNIKVEVTAPGVGIGLRDTAHPIMQSAGSRFLFTVWGRVTAVASDGLTVDDGSGTAARIYCGSAPVASSGQYIRATGALYREPGQTGLSCLPGDIIVLD